MFFTLVYIRLPNLNYPMFGVQFNKPSDAEPVTEMKKSKRKLYKTFRILCTIGFVLFFALLINEVVIQPIRIKKSVDLTRDLYIKPTEGPTVTPSPAPVPDDVIKIASVPVVTVSPTPEVVAATPTPDPNRDAYPSGII